MLISNLSKQFVFYSKISYFCSTQECEDPPTFREGKETLEERGEGEVPTPLNVMQHQPIIFWGGLGKANQISGEVQAYLVLALIEEMLHFLKKKVDLD